VPVAAPGTAGGELSATRAIAVLAAMAVAATVLVAVTVRVAARGLAAATAPPAVASGQLFMPAPAAAGGLPRRYRPLANPATLAAMNQFRRLFTGTIGAPASVAGLYAEPGRIDLATDAPGWVMYLGRNAPAGLRAPAALVNSVLAELTGPAGAGQPGTGRSWPVAAGPGGGSARCGTGVIGGMPVAVCGWATGHVVAALMSPTRDTSVGQLAALLLAMRPTLQMPAG
jgi:hypothetical protein